MNTDPAHQAITMALCGKWKEALLLNKEVLRLTPDDTDALNRLAKAHFELGEVEMAKKYAKKCLSLQPTNQIARKSLERWSGLKAGGTSTSSPTKPEAFLEEPGRTKVTTLLNLSSQDAILLLNPAEELKITISGHRVCLGNTGGKHIGVLPDDLSARLKLFIKKGNEYQIFVKSAKKNEVKVFIRETKRCQELVDTPTFAIERPDTPTVKLS